MKHFFLIHPPSDSKKIWQTLSAKFPLSWSHYVFLLAIRHTEERAFYEIEAAKESWSRGERKIKNPRYFHFFRNKTPTSPTVVYEDKLIILQINPNRWMEIIHRLTLSACETSITIGDGREQSMKKNISTVRIPVEKIGTLILIIRD